MVEQGLNTFDTVSFKRVADAEKHMTFIHSENVFLGKATHTQTLKSFFTLNMHFVS